MSGEQKAFLDNFQKLQQEEAMRSIEELQYKEASDIFSEIVKDCFNKCVTDFSGKNVSRSEERCMK